MRKGLGKGGGLAAWIASAAAIGVFLTAAVAGILVLAAALPILLVLMWLAVRRNVPFGGSRSVVFVGRTDGSGKECRPGADPCNDPNAAQGACYDLAPSEYDSRPARSGHEPADAGR